MRITVAQAQAWGIVVDETTGRGATAAVVALRAKAPRKAPPAKPVSAELTEPVEFVVRGRPVGKQSARHAQGMRTYIPTKSRKYMQTVAAEARLAMAGRPPHSGAVKLHITVELEVPESWPKRLHEAALAGAFACSRKPDCSNICKGIEDAMQGIVMLDDKNVVELVVSKRWAASSRVVVRVEPARLPLPPV